MLGDARQEIADRQSGVIAARQDDLVADADLFFHSLFAFKRFIAFNGEITEATAQVMCIDGKVVRTPSCRPGQAGE